MKNHPHYETLQDYFENALGSQQEFLVKEHLLNCDRCTKMLADFTVIETRLNQFKTLEVSQAARTKILLDARRLLSERRSKKVNSQVSHELRQLQLEKLRSDFMEWKELLYPELRLPVLQICSISLVLATFLAVEKRASRVEFEYEPLSSDVSVFTSDDLILKEQK